MIDTAPTLSLDVDATLERVSSGGRLTADELSTLASSPDILAVGMMADAVRRRVAAAEVTYLRVALVERAEGLASVPVGGAELRAGFAPETLDAACRVCGQLREAAAGRTVSGFSWTDVERWAPHVGSPAAVLSALMAAGLDAISEVPIDGSIDLPAAIRTLRNASAPWIRLTVTRPAAMAERLVQLMRAAEAAEQAGGVTALAPLPMALDPLRPTTGYDDVKAVAIARLVAPSVPHVQVDWRRYGPKLAQVALTFGADDLDNVTESDEAPDGRRRAPIEELRRNVESAGFRAVERDGRYARLG